MAVVVGCEHDLGGNRNKLRVSSRELLGGLGSQGAHQPQTRFSVGEDPHHPATTPNLLVESLKTVIGADSALMALREGQAGQALL